MLIVAAQIRFSIRMRPDQNWRVACRSAAPVGHSARKTSALQISRPTKKPICQNAAELDVGQSLVAEPEPAAVDVAHDAQPVADQRAGDDDQRHPEQHIDEQPLAARLPAAGDRRGEKQAGADPAHTDPDDRRLDVHVAQEVERQEVVQVEPVEAAPVVVGVRHDRAGEDLQQQHGGDHQEVFADLALARRSAGRTAPAPGPSVRRPDGSARTRR